MSARNIVAAGIVAALCCLPSLRAMAVDGMAIEAGRGASTDMGRVALQWDWGKRWYEGPAWHVGGYWDVSLGHWRRDSAPGQNDDLTELGLTPVFRLQPNGLKGGYLEAGIGAHWLSRTRIGDKRMSTQFQFGDHLGAGYRFGVKGAWDLGYRYQHLSNGGIKQPNNGINFYQVRLQHHF